jgi:hypothetical protein
MDFVLLASMTRNPIVARARVMRHRQIPVIQRCSAVTNRAGGELELGLRELGP